MTNESQWPPADSYSDQADPIQAIPSNPSLARPFVAPSGGATSEPDDPAEQDGLQAIWADQGATQSKAQPARSSGSAAVEGKARSIVENPSNLAAYNKNLNVPWRNPALDEPTTKNTDCGVFASYCARAHDADYPKCGTSQQLAYVQGRGSSKWQVIRIDKTHLPQPGDILWKQGHTEVYVGDVKVGDNATLHGRAYGASLGSSDPEHGTTPRDKGSWTTSKGPRFTYIFRPK